MYNFLKRTMDIIGSLTLIAFFLPVCIITAVAIFMNNKGPVLAEIPKRVGLNGKLFKIYKFRSMIVNAHELLQTDPKFSKLYKEYQNNSYKLHNDPRVTEVGKIIRKHSIDEIPQLFNVLIGNMSLVGPRPYYLDELEKQTKKYPHTRKLIKIVLSARPGVTGIWQVAGRSEVNFDKRIQMDAGYVMKKSILFDLIILAKSPWVMISGKGAI